MSRLIAPKPCSLEDFLDYLVYVTHDAENLQFYLWLRDYTKRFFALPKADQALSPEWTAQEAAPDLRPAAMGRGLEKKVSDFSMDVTAFYDDKPEIADDALSATIFPPPRTHEQAAAAVAAANAQAGLRWESCMPFTHIFPALLSVLTPRRAVSIQPLRAECTLIAAHYLTPSSPRELNLSHRTRAHVLHALQHTTHPSAFTPVLALVAAMLRAHAHPNFVRWSLCNGNRPRILFLRAFASWWLAVAVALALILILSHCSRWIRIAVAPILWFGTTNMIAAAQGLCVLLHRKHTREVHPWELLPDETASARDVPTPGSAMSFPDPDLEKGASPPGLGPRLRALGPANAFDGEPWVARWRTTGWLRKLALREVRVREEALRVMQNRLVRQAEAWALLVTVPVVVGVVACPVVGLY